MKNLLPIYTSKKGGGDIEIWRMYYIGILKNSQISNLEMK